jgi:hypothetical protein
MTEVYGSEATEIYLAGLLSIFLKNSHKKQWKHLS